MVEVDYYRNEAAKYRKMAEKVANEPIKRELLELAAVCERVAAKIEDRMTTG